MKLTGTVRKVEAGNFAPMVRSYGYDVDAWVEVTVALDHPDANLRGVGDGGELKFPWRAKEQPQVGTPIEVDIGIAPARPAWTRHVVGS